MLTSSIESAMPEYGSTVLMGIPLGHTMFPPGNLPFRIVLLGCSSFLLDVYDTPCFCWLVLTYFTSEDTSTILS
jgi:hypothetical protein